MKNHRQIQGRLCAVPRSRGFIGNASSDRWRCVRLQEKATMYLAFRQENAVIFLKGEIDRRERSEGLVTRENIQTTCRFWRKIGI